MENINGFLEVCKNRQQVYKTHELESHLQAFFTIQLWANIPPSDPQVGSFHITIELIPNFEQVFANWILSLIRAENHEIVLEGIPSVDPEFVHRQHVSSTLHLMVPNENAFETVWKYLRSQTEQTNSTVPADFIAYDHIRQFALDYIQGLLASMAEIGYTSEMITDEDLSELREAI